MSAPTIGPSYKNLFVPTLIYLLGFVEFNVIIDLLCVRFAYLPGLTYNYYRHITNVGSWQARRKSLCQGGQPVPIGCVYKHRLPLGSNLGISTYDGFFGVTL